jgi:pimeloyl-ACP methyl ester carboxylesterase
MNPTATTVEVHSQAAGPISLPISRWSLGPDRAETVLLLHGGAGVRSVSPFAEALAASGQCEVLVPTHPGFEGTPRPAGLVGAPLLAEVYAAAIDQLGLRDVTVIGNSVGGWIAAELALVAAGAVGRLVLLDATGIDVPGHPVADAGALGMDEIVDRSFHDPGPFRPDPSALPAPARAVMAGNMQALAAYAGAGSDPTLLPRLVKITAPTMVVWGQSDRIADAAYGMTYAEAIPRASFHVLAATGHVPQLETPHHVLTVVTDFMAAGGSRQETAWSAEQVRRVDVTASALWSALHDLFTGAKLSPRSDEMQLHGPLLPGARLSVTPAGTDFTVECEVVDVLSGHLLEYRSEFEGLRLTSRHTLTPDGGSTILAHYQEIAGVGAAQAGPGLGARITADTATAMDDLIAGARTRSIDMLHGIAATSPSRP